MLENNKTLQAYKGNTQSYIDATPNEVTDDVKTWIDSTLALVPKKGDILEIGSAFGRDADYMESKGYSVKRTDAVEDFVEILKRNGHEAWLLNAIQDELGGPYDLIFADAVLLHFTTNDTKKVLDKVRQSLKSSGIFSFRIKKGNGTEWSDAKLGKPRFYQYWQADDITALLEQQGFNVLSLTHGLSKHNTSTWLQVIASKKTSE